MRIISNPISNLLFYEGLINLELHDLPRTFEAHRLTTNLQKSFCFGSFKSCQMVMDNIFLKATNHILILSLGIASYFGVLLN